MKSQIKKTVGEIAAEWWVSLLKQSISNGFTKSQNRSKKSILKSIHENNQSIDANYDFFKYYLAQVIDTMVRNGLEIGIYTGDEASIGIVNGCLIESGFKPENIDWPPETEMDISSESIVVYYELDPDPITLWVAERFPPVM